MLLFPRNKPSAFERCPSITMLMVPLLLTSSILTFADGSTAPSTLPYLTGFETSEHFSAGPINGQGPWTADSGVIVTTVLANRGDQAMVLPANSTAARASLGFIATLDLPIVFVDFYILPTASVGLNAFIQAEGAQVAFVQAGPGRAELYVFNGNGSGGGVWEGTNCKVAVDANNQSTSWLRVTVREDFAAHQWSLYLNTELKAHGKGFIDASKAALSQLTLIGQTTGPSVIDDLLIGFDNPLFTDANNNGIEDAVENTSEEVPLAGNSPITSGQPKQILAGADSPEPVSPLSTKSATVTGAASLVRLQVYLPLHR